MQNRFDRYGRTANRQIYTFKNSQNFNEYNSKSFEESNFDEFFEVYETVYWKS